MIPTNNRMMETFTPSTFHEPPPEEHMTSVVVVLLVLVFTELALHGGLKSWSDGLKSTLNGLPGAQTEATARLRQDASMLKAMIPVLSRPRRRRSRVNRYVPRIPVTPARPIQTPTTSGLTPLEYIYPVYTTLELLMTDRQTDRHRPIQTLTTSGLTPLEYIYPVYRTLELLKNDRQTDRQTDTHTDRQTDRQTDTNGFTPLEYIQVVALKNNPTPKISLLSNSCKFLRQILYTCLAGTVH